jgi:hypothetical protein
LCLCHCHVVCCLTLIASLSHFFFAGFHRLTSNSEFDPLQTRPSSKPQRFASRTSRLDSSWQLIAAGFAPLRPPTARGFVALFVDCLTAAISSQTGSFSIAMEALKGSSNLALPRVTSS